MTGGSERGFIAAELAMGIGLLVFPVALLVLTLPGWSERQATARVIAREVARRIVRDGVCDRGAARALGVTMARNLGVPADGSEVDVVCPGGAVLTPGADVEARVTRTHAGRGDPRDRCGGLVVVDRAPPRARRSLRSRAVRARGVAGTVTLWLLGVCLMLFAARRDQPRPVASVLRAAVARRRRRRRRAGGCVGDRRGDRYRASGTVVLVPALAESRAREHIARQLDRAALRSVSVRADAAAVTVVVHGEVGFTLLECPRNRVPSTSGSPPPRPPAGPDERAAWSRRDRRRRRAPRPGRARTGAGADQRWRRART